MTSFLKNIRIKACMTQADAADCLKVDQSTFQRWESGKTPIPKTKLKKIADLFGVTAGEITGRPRNVIVYSASSEEESHQYYGEVAIHFSSGANLLAPISVKMAQSIDNQFLDPESFMVIHTLDNRIVICKTSEILDIYITDEAADAFGPEAYKDYIGLLTDESLCHFVEEMEFDDDSDWLIDYIGKERFEELQAEFSFEKLDEAERAEATANIENLMNRIRQTIITYSSGKARELNFFDAQRLFSTFNLLVEQPTEFNQNLYISMREDATCILVNLKKVDFISIPAHKYKYGEYLANKEELGE